MFGLLRHNTILSHVCHSSEDEIELVKRRGVGISHLPSSFLIDSFELRIKAASLRTVKISLDEKSTRRILSGYGRPKRG